MTENMEYFDLWITDSFLSRVWQHEVDHLNGIHLASDQNYGEINTSMEQVHGSDIELSEMFQKVINFYSMLSLT